MSAGWNSRTRFREVMRFGSPDRVPYFEEGVREDTWRAWRKQGLRRGVRLSTLFPSDRREEPEIDLLQGQILLWPLPPFLFLISFLLTREIRRP